MISKTAARTFTRNLMLGTALAAVSIMMTSPAWAAAVAQEQGATVRFNIPAQNLDSALTQFARQSGQQLLYAPELVAGKRSSALVGAFTPRDGLGRLLSGSGIGFRIAPSGAFLLGTPGTSAALTQQGSAAVESASADQAGVAEILVVGSRSLNVDIARSEDDAQPYVTFDREQIRQAQATTVNDFLRTRLPQNVTQRSFNNANTSEINLRGLGALQTLVLVDGRRLPGVLGQLDSQPDINGIPLAAIERIEILPSTASGIYGGGATGGVVNIIRRRDYSGIDISATYGNTTRWDKQDLRVDFSAGFNLEGGNTNVTVTASHAETGALTLGERDFSDRARALLIANNPNAVFGTGAPPLGYSSNICRAAAATGSTCSPLPLTLDNGTVLTSNRTFVPVGYTGPASDGGLALIANAGQYNLALPAGSNGARAQLYGNTQTDSASASIRRHFGPHVEIYGDLFWSRNASTSLTRAAPSTINIPAGAPNNPFNTNIVVTFPDTYFDFENRFKTETARATVGAIIRLPHNWAATLDYAWSQSRSTQISPSSLVGDQDGTGPGISSTMALQNGTLNVLRDLNLNLLDYAAYLLPLPVDTPIRRSLDDVNLRLAGPLFRLPGGYLTLTGLAEYRREATNDQFANSIGADASSVFFFTPALSQSVISFYGELTAPFFSPQNARPFLHMLQVTLSARRDQYETRLPSTLNGFPTFRSNQAFPDVDYGSTEVSATKFTAALQYAPSPDISFRASYGTGFLPPRINQLVTTFLPSPQSVGVIDPRRRNIQETIVIDRIIDGDPDLLPENSRSWSVGAVITPRFAPGLRISIDYTNIRKRNEIRSLGVQGTLNLENLFPDRVVRDPLTPADAALGYTGGVIRLIDSSFINVADTRLEAYDFQADYEREFGGFGRLHLYAIGSYLPHFLTRTTPLVPFVDNAGFGGGANAAIPAGTKWRMNGGLTWDHGPWTVGWNAQYYDSYRICTSTDSVATCNATQLSQGAARIPSQVYHDLFVTFRVGGSPLARLGMENAEITLGIQNVFDKEPPILASAQTLNTSLFSSFADPRLRRFTLTARTHF